LNGYSSCYTSTKKWSILMDLDQLESLLEHEDIDIRLRSRCILLRLRDGLKIKEIAQTLQISQRTVERYLKQFRENGVTAPGSAGRPSKLPLIDELLSKPPYQYGYLLENWTVQMIQIETGADPHNSRRAIEQAGCLGSINDAILSYGNKKSVPKLLHRLLENGEQLWFTKSFRLGDDKGRKPKGHIGYKIDFYCFLSISLSEPDFLVRIHSISSMPRKDDDSLQMKVLERYNSFIQHVCENLFNQYNSSAKLLLTWTPINRSVISIVKSDRQAIEQEKREKRNQENPNRSQQEKKVIAQFIPPKSHSLHGEIKEFESFLRKEFIKPKSVDQTSTKWLETLSTDWWNQQNAIRYRQHFENER
jgi:DNA-binding CsgD family transcriptional regulator